LIGTAAIELVGLQVAFRETVAVRDLTLSVAQGEVFGFLGPNGAGKSSTIKVLLSLLQPSRGSVKLFGQNLKDAPPSLRQRVGYLPGDLALFPFLTGTETLDFFASIFGGACSDRVELQERLEFPTRALSRKIKSYSTGMRQKIGIIVALQHRPDLLILDEPSAGLDPNSRDAFIEILRSVKAEGRTVFFSSHLLEEVERCADRIGIMVEGKLRLMGGLAEVRRSLPREIRLVRSDGSHESFLHEGPWTELRDRLQALDLVDVEIRRQSLDEVFRSVARSGDQSP
jgi:ABC-2 type transport system ATP-binding protein